MVKMKEFTPTGGEESVRSMAENNDGGHESAVVKDGEDGKSTKMKNGSDVIFDDWLRYGDDADWFLRNEKRWKESANKRELESIMDFERMENRQQAMTMKRCYMTFVILLDERYQQQRQQQQQQQEKQEDLDDELNDTIITETMNE